MERKNIKAYSLLNQRGFTLFEVMISITILAFIMMSVISISESTQNTAERVSKEDRESLQIETALSRIEWDVSHAYSPLYFSHLMRPDGVNQSQAQAYNQLIAQYQTNERFSGLNYNGIPVPTIKTSEGNEISFFTSSNRRKRENIKQSNFAWVKYSLTKDDREKDFVREGTSVLTRQFLADDIYNSSEIEWDKIKRQVLLRNVESLKIEFWDPIKQKWKENLDTIKDGKLILRGLKMTITYIDDSGAKLLYVRVYRPLYPQFTPEDMYKLQKEINGSAQPTSTNQGVAN